MGEWSSSSEKNTTFKAASERKKPGFTEASAASEATSMPRSSRSPLVPTLTAALKASSKLAVSASSQAPRICPPSPGSVVMTPRRKSVVEESRMSVKAAKFDASRSCSSPIDAELSMTKSTSDLDSSTGW